ncbi:ATP synthase F1 subunit gamma [Candidatus Saccharibacteria bacterium]|nr:ATP synthase F1 subunit gamma [Candidatus Saccharibacteria bacterium]
MASTIVLKRRIGSIKSTRQITKAMQLVSASKLRRAQEAALRSRPYRDLALDLLRRLNDSGDVQQHPLFAVRPVKVRLHVIITSNSGLAGAYNANVLKLAAHALLQDKKDGVTSKLLVVGSKGAQFARRLANVELIAVYNDFGDTPTANAIRPILTTIIDKYTDQEIDEVKLYYTVFKSSIRQEAEVVQLLPAAMIMEQITAATNSKRPLPSSFEPDVETVIEQVATRLVEAQLWQAVLESLASEHAMRMLAMKNATDNAKDLIDDYTLELNTARQAAITQELAEISGGVEALK